MDIKIVRERLKELENEISRLVLGFEKDTECRITSINVTRITTINEQPSGYSYVEVSAEL